MLKDSHNCTNSSSKRTTRNCTDDPCAHLCKLSTCAKAQMHHLSGLLTKFTQLHSLTNNFLMSTCEVSCRARPPAPNRCNQHPKLMRHPLEGLQATLQVFVRCMLREQLLRGPVIFNVFGIPFAVPDHQMGWVPFQRASIRMLSTVCHFSCGQFSTGTS